MYYALSCQFTCIFKAPLKIRYIHKLYDNSPLIMIYHLTCPLFKLALSIFNRHGQINALVLTCKFLFVYESCWTCRKSVRQTSLKRSVYILIFASSPSVSNRTIYFKIPKYKHVIAVNRMQRWRCHLRSNQILLINFVLKFNLACLL